MTNDEYARLQEMWIKTTGVKAGSWVKVMRAAENHESGWNNIWIPKMDAVVGTSVRVINAIGTEGFVVATGNPSFPFCKVPFYVLEPAKEPKPEKYQFTPFELVLVRDCDADDWHISLFEKCIDDENGLDFRCINGFFGAQCIPYAGHEHLLGTKDEPEDWAKYYDKE